MPSSLQTLQRITACSIIIPVAVGLLQQATQQQQSPLPPVVAAANRVVTVNNLGGMGPQTSLAAEIRYSPMLLMDTGTGPKYVDLVVTASTPYTPKNTRFNGLHGRFGQVNLAALQNVSLVFSFQDTDTHVPVTIPQINVTFYDLDGPQGALDVESVTVDNADFTNFILTEATEVNVQEKTSVTVFTSTAFGTVCDNPTDITSLGTVTCPLTGVVNQRQRAFALMMGGSSSYHFTFTVGDTLDGSGRNFLFGIPATFDEFIEEPTSAPTSSPTKADFASSVGDPHLSSIKGEQFDIGNVGVYTLLAIPGATAEDGSLLHVQAKVEAFGASICDGRLYVTSLLFSGGWLGNWSSLEFATNISQHAPTIADSAVKITVGSGAPLWDAEELKAMAPRMVLEATKSHFDNPQALNEHVTLLLVKLELGPAIFKVRHVLQREKMGYSKSLWLSASSLHKVNSDIGGLLGNDDHTLASRIPDECSASNAFLRTRHFRNGVHASALLARDDA